MSPTEGAADRAPGEDPSLHPSSGRPGRRAGARRRWAIVLGALLVLGGLTAAFAALLARGSTEASSPLLGKPAPAFRLPGIEGGTVATSSFVGHVEVVTFWASWCAACQTEAGYLESFARRWGPRGVGVLGVVYADGPASARSFARQHGITYPNVFDRNGQTALSYGVAGVPQTFVVGSNGRILASVVGGVGADTLPRLMSRLANGEQRLSLTRSGFERSRGSD